MDSLTYVEIRPYIPLVKHNHILQASPRQPGAPNGRVNFSSKGCGFAPNVIDIGLLLFVERFHPPVLRRGVLAFSRLAGGYALIVHPLSLIQLGHSRDAEDVTLPHPPLSAGTGYLK
eukprot:806107-Pyramimonas_sp.AAC.1